MFRRRWTVWMILCGLVATPVCLAGEEKADKDEDAVQEKTETAAEKDKTKDLVKKMAELTLDHNVVSARMLNIPWAGKTKTLREVMEKLQEWTEEDEIGAVFLNITDFALSFPDVQELRQGVARLREKGNKKVFAYFNGSGPMGYMLACAADEICMAPSGGIYLPGLGGAIPYMQGHFQMLGLEYDVIAAGKYKYPGVINRREPNKYTKEEYGALLDSWFDEYVNTIAEGRNLERKKVLRIIDQAILRADEAVQRGLADHLAYHTEYRDRVLRRERMKRYKDYETDWSQINSLQDLLNMMSREWQKEKERREAVGPKIAVLNARGVIIDTSLGPAFASMFICRDDFIETIEEIRKNKSVKAVVLRIDSPGGSGYASDAIWQKLVELDEEKPLVVSMGFVAGSGGYYIAVPGRLIFAQPTTLTGSIGVLGIIRSAWSAFNRADYNLYFLQRGARSLMGRGYRPLDKKDRAFIQKYILDFYEIFIDRVARGRKMAREQVKEIAEGRIYTGRDALEIGLVDRLGGLEDAVEAVREMANIPPSAKLRLVHYPRPSSLGEIVANMGAMGTPSMGMNSDTGIGAFMNLLQNADAPATGLSFEKQLELLSQTTRPLCWMPIPGLTRTWNPDVGSFGPTNQWSEPSPQQIKELLFKP